MEILALQKKSSNSPSICILSLPGLILRERTSQLVVPGLQLNPISSSAPPSKYWFPTQAHRRTNGPLTCDTVPENDAYIYRCKLWLVLSKITSRSKATSFVSLSANFFSKVLLTDESMPPLSGQKDRSLRNCLEVLLFRWTVTSRRLRSGRKTTARRKKKKLDSRAICFRYSAADGPFFFFLPCGRWTECWSLLLYSEPSSTFFPLFLHSVVVALLFFTLFSATFSFYPTTRNRNRNANFIALSPAEQIPVPEWIPALWTRASQTG